ncbi:hypothetical protein Hypma_008182 [Hypsizygus marmoreus]|uniref:Uncharacterized protein n=1 Tax=Hypsizygus marmoreus TaxID=39966 RepID=A0A369JYW9_HYPMA|nr:hypothetical protein Hypma_008182 [Hypsizygus marmoreus]
MVQSRKKKAPVTCSKANSGASNSRATRSSKEKKTAPVTSRKRQVSDDEVSSDSSSDGGSRRRPQKKCLHHRQEPEAIDNDEPQESEPKVVDNEVNNEGDGEEDEEEGDTNLDSDNKETDDNLQPKHQITIPLTRVVKKQSTKDLLLMMSDIVNIKVKHYELYKKKCKEKDIPENHWAIPHHIWREMEEEKWQKNKKKVQAKIEFEHITELHVFSREGVLRLMMQLIAVDDQLLVLADKAVFRNCLVAMRPKATRFVKRLKDLKIAISKAPGKVSITSDAWTVDITKAAFLGVTAHWIDIIDHDDNDFKLSCATLDNTSSNTMLCEMVEDVHLHRSLPRWNASEGQPPHVVNIGNVAVMSHITKIAALETTITIWEYDPTDPNNRVFGGSLDVIAAICTLMIKPMGLFLSSADGLFRPITTLRYNGCVFKHISWTAFKLSEADWNCMVDAVNILADSNCIQQYFSAEKQPTLWHALPTLEELQTA